MSDNIELAGTLTKPKKDKIKAAVVLITGSGPQDRDETIAGHKPFLVIADFLSSQGYAVLRLDDRGVADSGGNFKLATSQDFVKDISSAVDFLKTRQDLATNKIGLIGHSEGAMIAQMLAAKRKDLAFAILLAGPGVPISELMAEQQYMLIKAQLGEKDWLNEKKKIDLKMFQQLANKEASSEVSDEVIQKLLKQSLAAQGITSKVQQDKQIKRFNREFGSPWFRYFVSYQPEMYLSKMKLPVLAINGSLDVQVEADSNLNAIKKSMIKAKNKDYEIVKLENLNHLFQTAKTGSVTEYARLEETFSQQALDTMLIWLEHRFK